MSAKTKLQAALDAIAKIQAKLPELEAAAANEFDTNLVQPGVTVEATFGRAEKRRQYTGVVVARKPQPKGDDVVKVQVGDGFDAQFVVVSLGNIVRIVDTAASADDALSTQG